MAVIPIEDPLKREFYIEMCKLEKWSVRIFRERIKSMLYERTETSKNPEIKAGIERKTSQCHSHRKNENKYEGVIPIGG